MTFSPTPGCQSKEDAAAYQFTDLLTPRPAICEGFKYRYGHFVFIGRLTNKHGSRLVLIRMYNAGEFSDDDIIFASNQFDAYVFKPGGVFSTPLLLTGNTVEPSSMPEPRTSEGSPIAKTSLWIGVKDAKDLSGFILPFWAPTENEGGTFRGWLDDTDHIHLVDTSTKGLWARYETAESQNHQ